MKDLHFNYTDTLSVLSEEELSQALKNATQCNELLHSKQGAGNDFLGWIDTPSLWGKEDLVEVKHIAEELRQKSAYIVTIGIGGSYLGARCVIEALTSPFATKGCVGDPQIVYAGHTLSEDYLAELSSFLEDKEWSIIVISKSGTTTEPAIAFRVLEKALIKKYGAKEGNRRIVAVTDGTKGALRSLSEQRGYKNFTIPDNVGGRFSVFTPVGLLPIACAGIEIEELLSGAISMQKQTTPTVSVAENRALHYAANRYLLYKKGYKIELLVSYLPTLQYLAEWWKQLYGESEGKEGKGLFPASVNFTTDLHSMGQYIQEGERHLIETLISVVEPQRKLTVPSLEEDSDGLNYLAGERIESINRMATLGTTVAHTSGGVPNMELSIPSLTPYYIGGLLYFFQKSCGISGYLLGVNPFDQPGVEVYKKNMFALLQKPGYEKESAAFQKMGIL